MVGKTIEWGQGDKGVILDSVLQATINGGSYTMYLVKHVTGYIQLVNPRMVTHVS